MLTSRVRGNERRTDGRTAGVRRRSRAAARTASLLWAWPRAREVLAAAAAISIDRSIDRAIDILNIDRSIHYSIVVRMVVRDGKRNFRVTQILCDPRIPASTR